jgi:AcrR family transcriptional regulator
LVRNQHLGQRARQPEQKEERRRAILAAALHLWGECTFEEFTMAQLAARLGLAKGTLYLYFQTKEELFVVLLDQLLENWLVELASLFRQLKKPARPQAVAATVLSTLQVRRDLIRLLPFVETLLDRGASDSTVIAFERRALNYLTPAGEALEAGFPTLPAGSGVRLLLLLRALIMGIYLRANKPARIRHMLSEHPDLQAFNVRFDAEFVFAAEALIEGFVKLTKRQGNQKK